MCTEFPEVICSFLEKTLDAGTIVKIRLPTLRNQQSNLILCPLSRYLECIIGKSYKIYEKGVYTTIQHYDNNQLDLYTNNTYTYGKHYFKVSSREIFTKELKNVFNGKRYKHYFKEEGYYSYQKRVYPVRNPLVIDVDSINKNIMKETF